MDPMQQQLSLITLGVADLARSRQFYVEGFGWSPIFEAGDIIFYQMNGFILGTWSATALAADSNRPGSAGSGSGGFVLSHNVPAREAVQPAIDRLCRHGGSLLKAPVEPFHGGLSGHVADPDGHAWEIAWNPAWAIGEDGRVTFGL